MRRRLIRHPDTPCDAVEDITVEVARPAAGALALRYIVTGDASRLRLPPPAPARRADDLWKGACFEAFLKRGEGYLEFNVAPSSAWAAYAFDGYRSGMTDLPLRDPPRASLRMGDDGLTLDVALSLDGEALLPLEAGGRLGLSAVIEEAGGRISYWALAHPPGKADFHREEGFALDLAALEEP